MWGCPKTYVRHTKNRQIGLLDRKKTGRRAKEEKKMLLDYTKKRAVLLSCAATDWWIYFFFKLLFAVGSYGDTFPCSWPSIWVSCSHRRDNVPVCTLCKWGKRKCFNRTHWAQPLPHPGCKHLSSPPPPRWPVSESQACSPPGVPRELPSRHGPKSVCPESDPAQ